MADAPSLDEFADSAKRRPGPTSYMDRLPADVREQILSSKAGHAVVTRWLGEIGYPDASQQMVTKWRQREGWTP